MASANEFAIFSSVKQKLWRISGNIALEFELSEIKALEILLDAQLCIHSYSRETNLIPDNRPLWIKFAAGYYINTLWMTFSYNTLWTDNVYFTSECVFSVHNSHIWFQTTVLWYLIGRLINDTVIFRKLFYRCCLKIRLELWSREWGFNTISSSSVWERCPTVVERDISGKVNWRLRADCMVSSVARPKSDGYFSCRGHWRSTFMQSLLGLWRSSRGKILKQLWQRSLPTR